MNVTDGRLRQAYYVRQLAPGWPAAFHAATAKTDAVETVQIPVAELRVVGGLLCIAIVSLVGLTLYIGRKKKTTRQ